MKFTILFGLCCAAAAALSFVRPAAAGKEKISLFTADDSRIQYTGRIDFSNPKLPRFWAGGVYITARFRGSYCDAIINDQVEWGKFHNFLEISVDNKVPIRLQLTGTTNTVHLASGLRDGAHTVTVCKDTEAGIGYLEFVGFQCKKLLSPPAPPVRKLEFIGDSITAGSKSDLSDKPCGAGDWYDQDNAYMGYGPSTARNLNADWYLSAVSGIGMIHSCCGMAVTMPDVYDRIGFQADAHPWDFSRFQPDAVTICLGQNDGEQDPDAFNQRYVQFVKTVRSVYPAAQIVLLTSPMGDPNLTAALKVSLTQVVTQCSQAGDKNVHAYFFSRSYNSGCGGHPDVAEHALIASELTAYLKSLMNW